MGKIRTLDMTKLTKKQLAEENTKRVLRVNVDSPAHVLRPQHKTLGNKDVRAKDWQPKERDPSVVEPRMVVHEGTYDGAELKPFDGRPGSMDFKKHPSKGLG